MAHNLKSRIKCYLFLNKQRVSDLSVTILLVGKPQRSISLQRHWDVVVAPSGKRAIQYADTHTFDLIIVDAVSMRTSGERICRLIKSQFTDCDMIHIHPKSTNKTTKIAEVTLCPPLSARRLIGVIHRLLDDNIHSSIQCGPFEMNPTTRTLTAHGQDVQLNPKLADLIELFFKHPNEILDRETIMKRVWDTSYMGDTRTLDVHIRHARNVLENGQKRPQFLKTVRGVGYRLEVQLNDA